ALAGPDLEIDSVDGVHVLERLAQALHPQGGCRRSPGHSLSIAAGPTAGQRDGRTARQTDSRMGRRPVRIVSRMLRLLAVLVVVIAPITLRADTPARWRLVELWRSGGDPARQITCDDAIVMKRYATGTLQARGYCASPA